jgi:hypothetical protein
MIENVKPVESLTVADLEANPVWQYANSDRVGETCVRPVKKIPAKNLTGKVIGAKVGFANGTQAWALIGNLDLANPRFTEHFMTLSIEHYGRWFALARYHDHDFADRGPEALAHFLGLTVDEVFPISVDVRRYAQGDPAALVVSVPKEPHERLTRADIIAMAVP